MTSKARKFIHTGDIHLGLKFENVSLTKEKSLARRNDLWHSFESIILYAKDKKVDFLLIAGDLFERNYFSLGDIKRVADLLSRAQDVNILISAGNHDSFYGGSLYDKVKWSHNVTIFGHEGIQKKYFKDLDTYVYGYSWNRLEFRENTLLNDLEIDEDSKNILLLHGDIANNSNYLPLNIQSLENLNMDYIGLGHIHKPRIFTDKIAYCGCPEPLDFSEEGERGFIEGQIDEEGTKIEFIPFNKRSFHTIDIELNGQETYLDIVDRIKGHGENNEDFYRFKLRGYFDKDLHIENIINELQDHFYHVEIVNEAIPDYDLEALEMENRDNIIGRFIKAMEEKGLEDEIVRDSLYRGLKVLLEGDS